MMQNQFLILASVFAFSSATCGGKTGLVCCSGQIWNPQIKECIKCPLGHFGVNCTGVCDYPSYGELCMSTCTCEKEKCNPARGCLDTRDQIKTTNSPNTNEYANSIPIKQIKTIDVQIYEKNIKTGAQDIDCNECITTSTPEVHLYMTPGYDALQIGMFSTTALLSLIFIVFLMAKIQRRCKKSKESKCNKDCDDDNGEGFYDELDEHTRKLKRHFLFNGKADAKIAFDETQKRYYIEFTALAPCCSEEHEMFKCHQCSVKEVPIDARQELMSKNDYINPSQGRAEQLNFHTVSTDTQYMNEGKGSEVRCADEGIYLIAAGEQE